MCTCKSFPMILFWIFQTLPMNQRKKNNPMIKLTNVTKTYKDGTVGLADINLHIKPKEFVSVVGQSGTGKTTLVKLIYAEERPNTGNIVIGGWNITRIRRSEIPHLRRQIGVVYQDFKLLPKKTVFENVAFALEVCGA